MFALALLHHRREQHQFAAFGQAQYVVYHLAHRLRLQHDIVVGATRLAGASIKQAQIVVDLGDGADSGAGVVRGGFLFDGDGRRQSLDMIDVRLFHDAEELASVGGERLHVATLALGVDGIEGERRLARARETGEDDQFVARQVEIDVLQVVSARAANVNCVHAVC